MREQASHLITLKRCLSTFFGLINLPRVFRVNHRRSYKSSTWRETGCKWHWASTVCVPIARVSHDGMAVRPPSGMLWKTTQRKEVKPAHQTAITIRLCTRPWATGSRRMPDSQDQPLSIKVCLSGFSVRWHVKRDAWVIGRLSNLSR